MTCPLVKQRSCAIKCCYLNRLRYFTFLSVCAQCLRALKNSVFGFSCLLDYCITYSTLCVKVATMTIREIINTEIERRGWSRYRLVQEIGDRIPERTVYNYMSGRCDLSSDRASIILEVLGLEIKPKTRTEKEK